MMRMITDNNFPELLEPDISYEVSPGKPQLDWPRFLVQVFFLLLFGFTSFSLGANIQKFSSPYSYHPWLTQVNHLEKQITDRVAEEDFYVASEYIIINGDFIIGRYTNTDSMLPLLDIGSTGLYINMTENVSIHLGDVISYSIDEYDHVSHRVVEIGEDEEGKYYLTKGDNLNIKDPFKVRREHINSLLVGILW